MLFNQNVQYTNSRNSLPNDNKMIPSPSNSFSNLNNLNSNNYMNNNSNVNINSPPSINPMSKLHKKKSSTINNNVNTNTNKSQLNINSINSKSSLPANNTNKQSNKSINTPNSTNTTNKRSPIESYKQPQQFQFIHRIFSNIFTTPYLTFNQLVYALKSIGIQIDTQRKFIYIKSIFDQLKLKNQPIIQYQQCVKIGIKLYKQEKNKPNSDLTHLQKCYYHMVQQANHLQIPLSLQVNTLSQFKSYINTNYPQQKYLTKQSLFNISQYLGMQNVFTQQVIDDILKYGDQQDKGYLTFQDILTSIQTSQILNK